MLLEDGTSRKIELDRSVYSVCRELARPTVADQNFLTLFSTIPEVFFPIDYIASRVSSAEFVLKRYKDDSVVWDNAEFNAMISKTNCLSDFRSTVYAHFVYLLATGNAYFRACVPDAFAQSKLPVYKNCRNFWTLPPDIVEIQAKQQIPIFGNAAIEDIIECYKLRLGVNGYEQINPKFVLHDKDCVEKYGSSFLNGRSRLTALMGPMSNLLAVYSARNVIYTKQGGLGWIVSAKSDDAGTGVLTAEEKKALMDSYETTYGLGKNQMPYGISDVPISFIRTNLSISELQPFDETLADAVQIAGSYGIPAVLVPRKDQSTFSNQRTAEKTVYTSKVIPMAKNFAKALTAFLGYEQDGLYIDVDFHHVDCLQDGLKELEDVNKAKSDRALVEFKNGLITLNDVRARIGESRVENRLFDKTLFEMTPEERETVREVMSFTANNSNNVNQLQNGRIENAKS